MKHFTEIVPLFFEEFMAKPQLIKLDKGETTAKLRKRVLAARKTKKANLINI